MQQGPPLLATYDDLQKEDFDDEQVKEVPFYKKPWVYLVGFFIAAIFLGIGLVIGLNVHTKTPATKVDSPVNKMGLRSNFKNTTFTDLPGCQIHPQMSCPGSGGDMEDKWKDYLWNTPPRNTQEWEPGFQDMNVLVGYARQVYSSDHKSCTVTIWTKQAVDGELTYYFDGIAQVDSSKTFDSSYTGILQAFALTTDRKKLVVDDIDFIWNIQNLPDRKGDFRNGQKGAIVELFGWPDADIAQECRYIAEAGYLGVKIFPHQEQVMSTQPMENILNPWYFMYQPVSYRLQGRAGTRNDLRSMIKTCRSYGLRVYADAVVNHMSGNGNDRSSHRNPDAGCTTWPGKQSSGGEMQSPYYTPAWTYQENQFTHHSNNVLEFPAVPYGPMDFHCDKSLNSWTDPNLLNTGWLSGLTDLDTSKDYVRQRIADYFVDLMSIGFSGFRVDAAKHIHPKDLAAIFAKFKAGMGGILPVDWFTWLEVLVGGEAQLLIRDSEYSYTTGLTRELKAVGFSDTDVDKVKIWWCVYPNEPNADEGTLSNTRKVIQNDDHDQQNPGSSSRDMHDKGCVLVKGCSPDSHRGYEMRLFSDPYEVRDNDNDYPIRMVLSSFYYYDNILAIPDGQSECSKCKVTCQGCKERPTVKAYQASAQAYSGTDYTRVHRDPQIIAAMRAWMHM